MVTIYFSPAAKQSQLDDVRALLAKNRKVKEFGFVSRRLALRREAGFGRPPLHGHGADFLFFAVDET